MTKPRPLDGGDSFWLEDNPLSALSSFDPLRETTAQSRALRKGERFIPFEERQAALQVSNTPLSLTPSPASPPPPSPSTALLELLTRANADAALSYMGLKILLAVLAYPAGEPISLSRFSELTGLSKTGVISGIRNSLDAGYLTRSQSCPRCGTGLSYTEDKKTVPCVRCQRDVPPQARYAVFMEDSPVSDKDRPVFEENSPPVFAEANPVLRRNRGVAMEDSPIVEEDSPPVIGKDRGAVTSTDNPVSDRNRVSAKATAFASRTAHDPVFAKDSPVSNDNSSPVFTNDSPRARADSESRIIDRDSDSRFPPSAGNGEAGRVVYGSQDWQQMTERLAKDSAKRIGDKSVGFHVKVWAHARKLDWEKGGRRHEDGLLGITQELAGKYNSSGKSQGALWTKMVRRYFEEKGHPLLTEAEQEEWKGIHGSYQPPNI